MFRCVGNEMQGNLAVKISRHNKKNLHTFQLVLCKIPKFADAWKQRTEVRLRGSYNLDSAKMCFS